eukprot:Clim_evm21s233 gene=Clim_evmTU21s233
MTTSRRRFWAGMAWLLTFWIPSPVLYLFGKKDGASRMAWREKVLFCFLVLCANAAYIFLLAGVSILFCGQRESIENFLNGKTQDLADEALNKDSNRRRQTMMEQDVPQGSVNAEVASSTVNEGICDSNEILLLGMLAIFITVFVFKLIVALPIWNIFRRKGSIYTSIPEQDARLLGTTPTPENTKQQVQPLSTNTTNFVDGNGSNGSRKPAVGVLVTCYTEDEDGLRSTLNSVFFQNYRLPCDHGQKKRQKHRKKQTKYEQAHPKQQQLVVTVPTSRTPSMLSMDGCSQHHATIDVDQHGLDGLDQYHNQDLDDDDDYDKLDDLRYNHSSADTYDDIMDIPMRTTSYANLNVGHEYAHAGNRTHVYDNNEESSKPPVEEDMPAEDPVVIFLVCDGLVRGSGGESDSNGGPAKTTAELAASIVTHGKIDTIAAMREFGSEVPYTALGGNSCQQDNNVVVFSARFTPAFEDMFPTNRRRLLRFGFNRNKKARRLYDSLPSLPVVIMAKIGGEMEIPGKEGNRGKRDSQVLLFQALRDAYSGVAPPSVSEKRMQDMLRAKDKYQKQKPRSKHSKALSPNYQATVRGRSGYGAVSRAMNYHLREVTAGSNWGQGLDLTDIEFLMSVDADTKLSRSAVSALVCELHRSPKIIATCGESLVTNRVNLWSRAQAYEYFINHRLYKTFESRFGTVTCLPGCFTMYRVRDPLPMRTPDERDTSCLHSWDSGSTYSSHLHDQVQHRQPSSFINQQTPQSMTSRPMVIARESDLILINDAVLNRYARAAARTMHEKNLLMLGEDRYLTTLLLKHHNRRRITFTERAQCFTEVPEKFRVLRSQRRRWINSTMHNLFTLISTPNLCGFCIFGIRFLIVLDLLSVILVPIGSLYLTYLAVMSFVHGQIPLASIFTAAVFVATVILMPLLLGAPKNIAYVPHYLITLPVFFIYLPFYAYWHMDDFAWGATRVVQGEVKGAGLDKNPHRAPLPQRCGHCSTDMPTDTQQSVEPHRRGTDVESTQQQSYLQPPPVAVRHSSQSRLHLYMEQ